MRRTRLTEMLVLLVLCTLLAIMLPGYIARVQDGGVIDTVVSEDVQGIRISRTDQMERCSLLEKCAFVLSEKVEFLEYVPVVGGKRLESQEAADNASDEMEILAKKGLFSNSGFTQLGDGMIYTAANSDNPSQSLVVWQFWMMDDVGEQYFVTLDDSTGKIINVKVLSMEINLDKTAPDYEKLAKVWGEYLGMSSMTVTKISYEKVNVQKTIESFGDIGMYVLESLGTDTTALEKQNSSKQNTDRPQGMAVTVRYGTGQDIAVDIVLYRNYLSYGFREAK